jgi:hypothetical protein
MELENRNDIADGNAPSSALRKSSDGAAKLTNVCNE